MVTFGALEPEVVIFSVNNSISCLYLFTCKDILLSANNLSIHFETYIKGCYEDDKNNQIFKSNFYEKNFVNCVFNSSHCLFYLFIISYLLWLALVWNWRLSLFLLFFLFSFENIGYNNSYYTDTDNIQRLCDKSCDGCSITDKNCSKCRALYYKKETNNVNEEYCLTEESQKPMYYLDPNDKLFKTCDISCNGCSITSKNCTNCKENYYKVFNSTGSEKDYCFTNYTGHYLINNYGHYLIINNGHNKYLLFYKLNI